MAENILETARRKAGLTQLELSLRAATSRPTLSAYESGRKSPTLDTAERILRVAGFALALDRVPEFRKVRTGRGRPFYVADSLWRLPLEDSLAKVQLPLSVNWSDPGRNFNLSDRRQRSRCYEIVLREGMPRDIATYVDGALLVDLWDDLVLPRELRREWSLTLTAALST
ncbi:MAG: helix-turn-helix domain-containing protein [Actinobacteria bacterium]|nr:helix-turn-helix domain-containing protein [Actinomycetota bacterium]